MECFIQMNWLDDLIDKTMNVELEKDTATSNGTFPVVPNSKVLYNGPLGQLAVPETEEASCELGRGTKWCTAAEKNNMFDQYSDKGPLYVWRDKNGEKYQFHFETAQFMDAKDHTIDDKTRAPSRLVKYAERGIKGRWPEAEPVIMQEPMVAVDYAAEIIRGRWSEAEANILKTPIAAADYAILALKAPWPEAESAIRRDRDAWARYSHYF
jgi:hypothetical protein